MKLPTLASLRARITGSPLLMNAALVLLMLAVMIRLLTVIAEPTLVYKAF